MTDEVRTRFAPSPTGYLHVGGARTALFNWLFARKHEGKFLLRIEDTDVARSGEEMVAAILEGLDWLGLHWDEDVVFQSQRLSIYQAQVARLLAEKKAYKCFATREELAQARKEAEQKKQPYKYDRRALKLSASQVAEFEAQGKPYVVRLFVEEGSTSFTDLIYGDITVSNSELDDFVILRSDGFPTYHLAVVVDDHEMRVSHVIRGDDHLSNTPKHLLLYQAFGWRPPQFAHLPLILGADKQRLSKRHGATAVGEYKRAGYLPGAMVNFLALLGWSPGDDKEIFGRKELIEAFSLDRISKKSAVFDETKLEWLNNQYILRMGDEEFTEIVRQKLRDAGLIRENDLQAAASRLREISRLLKPRIKRLGEIEAAARFFFQDPTDYDEKGVAKYWKSPELVDHLSALAGELLHLEPFTEENIEQAVRRLAEARGLSAAKLIHPTRLALTGLTATPGLFEIMAVLGKENVVRRLRKAVEILKNIHYVKQ